MEDEERPANNKGDDEQASQGALGSGGENPNAQNPPAQNEDCPETRKENSPPLNSWRRQLSLADSLDEFYKGLMRNLTIVLVTCVLAYCAFMQYQLTDDSLRLAGQALDNSQVTAGETLALTKHSIEIAQKSAADSVREFKVANELTRKSINQARRSFEIQTRAYVFVDAASIVGSLEAPRRVRKEDLIAEKEYFVSIKLINTGKTPATNIALVTKTKPTPESTRCQGFAYSGKPDRFFLGNGLDSTRTSSIGSFSQEIIDGLKASDLWFTFNVFIQYDDVFGKTWTTEHRALWVVEKAKFQGCGIGNSAS